MNDFDWDIWLKKLGKKCLLGLSLGGLAEASAYIGTEPVPTQYVWMTILAVEFIAAITNAIKHKYMA